MSFFKPVSDIIGESCSLQVLLSMKNGKMTVTIIPKFDTKKDDVVQHITPLSITNDPAELDRTLAVIISSSMADTKSFADNLKEYETGLKKAAKLISADAKSEKEKEVKPADVAIDTPPDEEKSPFKEPEEDMAEMPNHNLPESIEDIAGSDMESEEVKSEPENEPDKEEQEEEEEW